MSIFKWKVVIIDDEKMERTFIKKYIDWEGLDMEVAGEASNGEHALEVCKRINPDIILTDIKMPEMDGIEFCKIIKNLLPYVQIIFMSGYNDFEYAKSAVDIGAIGYILKPISIESAVVELKKASNFCQKRLMEIQEQNRLKNIIQENKIILKESLIRELLYGVQNISKIWDRISILDIDICKGNYCVFLIEIDDFDTFLEQNSSEKVQVLSLEIINSINVFIKNLIKDLCIETIKLSEKQFASIVSIQKYTDKNFTFDFYNNIAESIREFVYNQQGVSVTIGISNVTDNIIDIKQLYSEAKEALRYKFLSTKGQIININDINYTNMQESESFFAKEIIGEILEILRYERWNEIDSLIDRIFDKAVKNKRISHDYIKNITILIICSAIVYLSELNMTFDDILGDSLVLWNKISKFETIIDVKQWLKNIYVAVKEGVEERKKGRRRKIVENIINIIEKRYDEDLTTKKLSKEIFLSPNYIGAIFKEETGKGFLEYLTSVRITKACELLKNPNLKIYEVAQMVGYSNVTYFSTIFKDFTGKTPSEYRQ